MISHWVYQLIFIQIVCDLFFVWVYDIEMRRMMIGWFILIRNKRVWWESMIRIYYIMIYGFILKN
jgi:hypothetical protein